MSNDRIAFLFIRTLIVIKHLQLNENGQLFVSWDFSSSILDEQVVQLEIFDPTTEQLLFQRALPSVERTMEMNLRKHLQPFPPISLICLGVRHERSCRNVESRRTALARFASSVSTSSDRYLHFLLGAILGAAFISFLLILFCLLRTSTLIAGRKRSMFVLPRARSSFSSSTATDPYHIYQQITALHSCPHQRLRTEPIYL